MNTQRLYGVSGLIALSVTVLKQKQTLREQKVCVVDTPRKYLAQAECKFLAGYPLQGIALLFSVVDEYPKCAEAWSSLGTRCFYINWPDLAFKYLSKAVNLGKSNGKTSEPRYPRFNNHLGNICYSKEEIDLSSEYYKEATRTCSFLTVAHLGLSDIMRKAKVSFEVAKELNPILVRWANFDNFRAAVAECKGRSRASGANQRRGGGKSGSGGKRGGRMIAECKGRYRASGADQRSGGGKSSSGRGGGGNVGRGSDGSGEDSDNDKGRAKRGRNLDKVDAEDEKFIKEAMEKVKKEAPAIKEYNGRKYYQSKDEKYWYVKDTAGHAGSLLKKYKDRRSSLEFVGSMSIDEEGNLVDIDPEKKHESNKIPFIEKSKMKTIK